MKLNEFYARAAQRADEVGTRHYTVEVTIDHTIGSGPNVSYAIYMPPIHPTFARYTSAELALQAIGALPKTAIEDDTELENVARRDLACEARTAGL